MHNICSHVANCRFDFQTIFGFVSHFKKDYTQINHLKVGGRTWTVALQISMIKVENYRKPVEQIFPIVFAFKYLTMDEKMYIWSQCILHDFFFISFKVWMPIGVWSMLIDNNG